MRMRVHKKYVRAAQRKHPGLCTKMNEKMPTPRHKLIHNPIPTSLFLSSPCSQFNAKMFFSLPNAFTTNKQNSEQRCRDGVMNEFVSWCRHLLVSFLFHALTSLYIPLHFIEMIFPLVDFTHGHTHEDNAQAAARPTRIIHTCIPAHVTWKRAEASQLGSGRNLERQHQMTYLHMRKSRRRARETARS